MAMMVVVLAFSLSIAVDQRLHWFNTGAVRTGTFVVRFARGQRLPHRTPVHPMTGRQLTDRHIRIILTFPTDRFEHPDTTPNRHSGPSHARRRTCRQPASGGARSDRPITAPECRLPVARSDRHGGGQIRVSFPSLASGSPDAVADVPARRPHPSREGYEARGFHSHMLRHTAASLTAAAGADVKVVQSMLGHKSATLTLDLYGHLFGDRLDGSRTPWRRPDCKP